MLDRAGIVGEDGPTHHGLFDVSYLRSIPNLVFMAPKDENELQHMITTALQLSQPVAIRYPRGAGQGVPLDDQLHSIPVGKAEMLCDGQHAAIFAIGSTVYPAREAAARLRDEGMICAVVNSRFIKPIDTEMLSLYARKAAVLITVEENVLQGGFGSAVLEGLQECCETPRVLRLGIPDTFVEHGPQKYLRARYGIDAEGIYQTVKKAVKGGRTDGVRIEKTATG